MITVKAGAPNRVALWETNADHPAGEAFVAGDIVAVVAETAEVKTRLNSGLLVATEEAPTLPFVGYDDLSVADVVGRLGKEGDTGRIVIRQYEAATKKRKAILGAVGAPFADYDSLTAPEVVERMTTMTDEEKAAVMDYETAHKGRKTIVEA